MTKDFYKSTRWKTKRTNILKRDDYLCVNCKRYGKSVQATTVHHIQPIGINVELRLSSNNLISLCSKCHDKMHDRSNNELTPLGKYYLEKIKK